MMMSDQSSQTVDNYSRPPSVAAFVYRGQLDAEFSRIRFLLGAVSESFKAVDAVLLSPGGGEHRSSWETFAKSFSNVRQSHCIDAPRGSVLTVRGQLSELFANEPRCVLAVGFSAVSYLPSVGCRAWFVNGIPEERLLHNPGLKSRLEVRLAWRAARRAGKTPAVVVSEPMAKLIRDRLAIRTMVIPNAVDRSIYASDQTAPPVYLTYEGGGSPWQGLDHLGAIWKAMHAADSSLRFRVITRDERARALTTGIDPAAIEVVSADDHHQVAELLAEARLGFLVREPGVVNEVAWPMKLGEYLAAGAPVIASRCGWDVERVIERHGAGLLVEWSDPAEVSAQRIARYLDEIGATRPAGVVTAADELDAVRWHRTLVQALEAIGDGERAQSDGWR